MIIYKLDVNSVHGVADSESPRDIEARSRAINRHACFNLTRTVARDIQARISKVGSWR